MNDDLELSADSSTQCDAGSGANSLAGYDYQIDVSIWLALDLMLGSGLTQMVELEPGSEEDLEAQLVDDEPGRVATRIGLDGYTLVVQVKLRHGDAWTVSDLNRLLTHGSATRLSAARRLADSAVRYLLVTSAVLNGTARILKVKRAGSWPKKSKLPATTAKLIPTDALGRIAVIDNLDEDRLVQEIKRLLIERFGVPNSRWVECLHVLRSEARLRVRRVGEGRWRWEELAHVIRNHDGYLASSPQLEDYVHPRNWQELRDAMGSPNYAAIIIGQSGTGKTLATSKIYEELRRENPGLTRVRIRRGPQQLRDDCTPPPVLYDIEDPWGRYDFDPDSRPWNDELSQWMSKARANTMIIATSRRDVAISSGALKTVEPWIVPLEAEHYGKPERQQLFRTRIDTLPRDVRLLATDAEQQVLDKLATPLEIEKFFDALRTMGRPQSRQGRNFIADAIAKAHEHSIELTVIQQIEERDDVRAAAVIWGFLKASDRLSLRVLRGLELELAERIPALEKGVTPLVDFFVAARNLRSGAGDVTYYHPRVEAGLESTLKRHAVSAVLVLRTLLDVLTDPDGPGEDWGTGIAAHIVAAAKRIPELTLNPRQKTASKIDSWLEDRLIDRSSKLREYVNLAASSGSSTSNPAEFARYLLHRPDRDFGSFHIWGIPGHPDAWYARLRADPAIATIAERFVREMLSDDRDHYSSAFVGDLDRLAPHLTSAYLDAAATMVWSGYTHSSDVVAAGALRDLDGFEPVIDSAIKALTPSKEDLAKEDETHLAIINDVYSSDYAEHLGDNDEGYTAGEFLQAYVDRVREVKGWTSLAQHRHAEPLLYYWMRSFMNDSKEKPPLGDEIAGAFTATFGRKEEDAPWFVLTQNWDKQYRERLFSRIREGSPLSDVRHAALACLVEQAPDFLIPIVDELRYSGNNDRVIELMIDLAHLQERRTSDGAKHDSAATIAMNCLESVLRELCEAAMNSANDGSPPLSSDAIALLTTPAQSSSSVRALRVRRHLDVSGSVRADIEWTLTYSDDRDACVEAIDAAIALNIEDVISGALDHRFAHVVAKALTKVGECVPEPLPMEFLALADSKGSPVRKALVNLLAAKPHPEHLPVLLRLAQDQWSSSSRFYGEDDNFPIARIAVDAIRTLKSLDPAIFGRLQDMAFKTSDWVVRIGLFRILVVQGGRAFQEKLFELAVTPGRMQVRSAAARAMLVEADSLDLAVVGKITTDILAIHEPSIAAMLTLIVALRASLPERMQIAREISANPRRRALILMMLWPKVDPCETATFTIGQLLPDGHASVTWALAGPAVRAEDDLIADLGDPAICREVLHWLNPEESKTASSN